MREARQLSRAEFKELMHALVDMIPEGNAPASKKHSILELRGLGAEIWEGIDAKDYLNELRSEWGQRP